MIKIIYFTKVRYLLTTAEDKLAYIMLVWFDANSSMVSYGTRFNHVVV